MKSLFHLAALFLFLISFSGKINAQDYKISGNVKSSSDNVALAGAVIKIQDTVGNIISYAIADAKGTFCFEDRVGAPDDSLCISSLGFSRYAVLIGNKRYFSVKLDPQDIKLKEITVKARKMILKGDTLSYNAASYTDSHDRTVEDILKKMPGIEVKESGEILYQGKSINHLYINGMDLLGGNYSLATENISPSDLKSVEVLENHQPVKALRKISFSERAAINLKLKDRARAKWIGSVKAAGGDPSIWSGNLFTMRMGGKMQSLTNVKTDHSGTDLSNTANTFSIEDLLYPGGNSYKIPPYISVGTSSAPLDEKRRRFDHSHLINIVNNWKLSDDYRLKVGTTASCDRLNFSNSSLTNYYLNDRTISDRQETRSSIHNYSVDINADLSANTDKFYINNKFEGLLYNKKIHAGTSGTYNNDQTSHNPGSSVKDDFRYVRRLGGHTFKITSTIQIMNSPQKLDVEKYRDSESSSKYNIGQDITADAIFNNTSISYGMHTGPWSLTLTGGETFFLRNLRGKTNGHVVDGILKADDFNSKLRKNIIYFTPSLTYESNRVRFTANAGADLFFYNINGNNTKKYYLSPSLFIKYSFTAKLFATVFASVNREPASDDYMFYGSFFSNYRHLQNGSMNISGSKSESVDFGISYKDPVNSLFASGNLIKTFADNSMLGEQDFTGDYIISGFNIHDNRRNSCGLTLEVSKGVDFMKGMIKINFYGSRVAADMMQDGELTPYKSRYMELRPSFNGYIGNWCDFDYSLVFKRTSLLFADGTSLSRYDNIGQRMKIDLVPFKKTTIKLVGEHYMNDISESVTKHTLFADGYLMYSADKKTDITFGITNILNKKTYDYKTNSTLTSVYSTFRIRPRNIFIEIYRKF
ncbi:MAG: TonB-dependent receptor [Bacteroidales bacterium]|jgi:hypothetical protein|nr:TonB-dependent receptor [Bacteroidales bacterium]